MWKKKNPIQKVIKIKLTTYVLCTWHFNKKVVSVVAPLGDGGGGGKAPWTTKKHFIFYTAAGFLRTAGSCFNAWSILAAMSPTAAVRKWPSLHLGSPPFHGFNSTLVDAQRDLMRMFRSLSSTSEFKVSSSMMRTTPHRWKDPSSTTLVTVSNVSRSL